MSDAPKQQYQYALRLAADYGFAVFPVDHPSHRYCRGIKTRTHNPASCKERGKHPMVKWSEQSTADVEELAQMAGWSTAVNIGIDCGKSNLVVIDEDADKELDRFCADRGVVIPDTFTVQSASGRHFYLRQPAAEPLGNGEGAFRGYKINIRGAGGYVVGPGSLHATGVIYTAIGDCRTIAPTPDWLITAVNTKPAKTTTEDGTEDAWWRAGTIVHPKRHNAMVAAAGWCRHKRLTRNEAIPIMRDVFSRIVNGSDGVTYTWDDCLARLDDIYARYDEGVDMNLPALVTVDGDPIEADALPEADQEQTTGGYPSGGRRVVNLTTAADIAIRPVHWLWQDRIAMGTLGLIAGPEGIGKSTFTYQVTADITRGTLPGRLHGTTRAVIVAATEDSWGHTIVPRLMAAGADLTKVFRVDVTTSEGTAGYLTLPSDLKALEDAVIKVEAAVILLDPLMSRLGANLDTHKDAEVRVALEPLVEIADRAGAAVLGLIHFNKSGSSDPLQLVMGSKAFTAVARSVFAFARDPDDDNVVLVGQVKNNLGRSDLPTLKMAIVGAHVADTDDGPVLSSRIVWQGETAQGIGDAIADSAGSSDDRTATQEAADWLADWLTIQGGSDDSATIKREGAKAGHSKDALKRARRRVGAVSESGGFPRKTIWLLPVTQKPPDPGNPVGATVGADLGESAPTALTAPTGDSERSRRSGRSGSRPPEVAPTGQSLFGGPDDNWPSPGEPVVIDGKFYGTVPL